MSSRENDLYEFGPYVMDVRSRILLKDGATVRLTPKAFDTLLVLVRHASQVVEKEQLLREVWPGIFVDEGSLSHNIHGLRKVFGDDSSAPDGKRIAFTSLREGNKDVYVIDADGSNPRRLTDHSGVDSSPRWSVDGRILFTSNRADQPDIYVMDHTGQNIARLTTIGAAGHAAWAPDGRKIAFVSRSSEIIGGAYWLQVYVIDADGSNLRMITRSPNSTFVPKWSADGAKITFVIEYDGLRANIFEMPAEQGRTLKRLTAGPKFDGRPAYSPDGTKLAFESNRDGNFEIYVMRLR